jgi:hypothetical protein
MLYSLLAREQGQSRVEVAVGLFFLLVLACMLLTLLGERWGRQMYGQ